MSSLVAVEQCGESLQVDEDESGDDQEVVEVEKVHPLDVLTEEVWLIIFDKLPPKDLRASSQVCITFEEILEPRRDVFLSALVLPHLKWDFIRRDHFKRQLLDCRLVCRSWKHIMDSHCQSFPFFETNYPFYTFTTLERVDKFRDLMESRLLLPQANPFISRNVKFDDLFFIEERKAEVHILTFWEAVAGLLRAFGKHIWYCELNINYPLPSRSYLYQQLLVRFTTLMPNVRAITFLKYSVSQRSDQNFLDDLVASCPLPNLPHLVGINQRHLPPAVMTELLRSCDASKLEQLRVLSEFDCGGAANRFMNLKRIHLNLSFGLGLKALDAATWPLEEAKLVVALEKEAGSGGISLEALFGWLNQFGKTLRKLQLTLSGGTPEISEVVEEPLKDEDENEAKQEELRLRLPSLEELSLEAGPLVGLTSLDFAEHLRGLRQLKFRLVCSYFEQNSATILEETQEHEEDIKEVIQFRGRVSQMLESNVWEVLPRLVYLSLRDRKSWTIYRWRGSPGESIKEEKTT